MVVALKTRRRSAFKVLRYVATGVLVAAALVAARHGWRIYVTSPWTRDGMVRVQVANVAPQISGQIVQVRTHDNEHVHKGDVLYVIEKFDFEVALDNAKATILNREADLAVKKAQNARRVALTTLSTSIEEKQVFEGNARMAEAALASAEIVFGGERHLQLAEIGKRARPWPLPFDVAPVHRGHLPGEQHAVFRTSRRSTERPQHFVDRFSSFIRSRYGTSWAD